MKKPAKKKSAAKKPAPNNKAKPAGAPIPAPSPELPAVVPAHQWTNSAGEVLILKCVSPDGSAFGGFKWPLTVGATVEAPDWDPRPRCGGGLHGWAWGIGIGGGKDPDWKDGLWLVFGCAPENVAHITDNGAKDKAKCGVIRFVAAPGDWQSATNYILSGQIAWVHQASSGAASATGDRGAASATGYSGAASATGSSGAASATGDRGAASATGYSGAASATGDRGAASATGDRGAASATGYSGAASATGSSGAASATGDRGAASATGYSGAASATGSSGAASATGSSGAASATGDRGAASATGDRGAAIAGYSGMARAGKFGCVAIAWWNQIARRQEMRCREVGVGDGSDGKLKAGVWYRLNEGGEFVEVAGN